MSKYEWEQGTIVLPSAEVARVRQVLIATTNRVRDLVPGEVAKAHAAAEGTRSVKLYRERVLDWSKGYFATTERPASSAAVATGFANSADYVRAARAVAHEVISEMVRGGKIIKPTAAMIDKVLPRATNRTQVFRAVSGDSLWDGSFHLEGRSLTWTVEENNRSVERASDTPLALAVFAHLGKVTWTRGSGGEIVGNDEYNQEADYAGGGANYVTREYGPHVKKEPVHYARVGTRAPISSWYR